MTKEELLKQLEEEKESVEKIRYKTAGRVDGPRFLGRLIELERVINLAEKLDEPKKVVIPKLIAKLIEGASLIYGNEPLRIAHGIVAKGTSNDSGGSWLSDVNNQKLLLNAIANGYEVEKEPKYRVPLPNLNSDNGKQFITYKNSKWFACAHCNNLQQEFTEVELANLPEPYCDYERVEVKDND